jgi:hypothetical protein
MELGKRKSVLRDMEIEKAPDAWVVRIGLDEDVNAALLAQMQFLILPAVVGV